MTQLRADLDALSELVDRLMRFTTLAEQLGDELDARVRALHADWVGAASSEHRAAHARWATGADEMRAGLEALSSAVATARENYAAAAGANVRMWS